MIRPFRFFCLFLGIWICVESVSQNPIRAQEPVLSPSLTEHVSGVRRNLRALVIGVGHYQHSGFADLPYARRDAEAFAAFLKTPAGGSIGNEDLTLLTNEQATLASVSDALNWLVDLSGKEDKIVVFCSVQGQVSKSGDARLLLFDSPPAPIDAGFLPLARITALLGKAAQRKRVQVFLLVEIQPCHTPASALASWAGKYKQGGLSGERLAGIPDTSGTIQKSFGNTLLYALLGMADWNEDQKIMIPEVFRYLKEEGESSITTGHCAVLATSAKTDWVCRTREQARKQLSQQPGDIGTPILHLEVQPLHQFLPLKTDTYTRQLYEDFILNIRLEQLLLPAERCAATLFDSLMQREALAPVRKQLRRRMAVAYQDAAQQALNAYLQTSSKELARRHKNHDHYKLYPQYLQRAIDLLDRNHFILRLLEAKRLYFEGLALRLDAQHNRDAALLPLAMEKQQQSIALEPDAAFVYNEMGVVADLSNQPDAAERFFRQALEHAPAWGIPQMNISTVLYRRGHVEEAKAAGYAAIALAPWNPRSYLSLGNVFKSQDSLAAAEILYRRALLLDPAFPDAHYNLACIQSLTHLFDAAIESLRLAMLHGFDNPKLLLEDPDLNLLRDVPAFQRLLAEYFPGYSKH